MKNIILIATYIIIAALTLGIVMTLHGREARSMELSAALPSAAEEAAENMALAKNYEIENNDLLIADFIESLSVALETESDITVRILKADREEGILSVEAEETYRHPNGNTGSVKCARTVLFNRLMEDPENICEIRFYLTREDMENLRGSYKTYAVMEGDTAAAPAAPAREGMQFAGWKDADGQPADFAQPAVGSASYYAEWN